VIFHQLIMRHILRRVSFIGMTCITGFDVVGENQLMMAVGTRQRFGGIPTPEFRRVRMLSVSEEHRSRRCLEEDAPRLLVGLVNRNGVPDDSHQQAHNSHQENLFV
jgi:hypothetical protein